MKIFLIRHAESTANADGNYILRTPDHLISLTDNGILVETIMTYIKNHNEKPKSFTWTAKADDILTKVTRARAVLNNVQSI